MRRLFTAWIALLLACSLTLGLLPCAIAVDSQIEDALEWAEETAEDDTHGYSRYSRTGPNYDCSSFVSAALMEAGFELEGYLSTSRMKSALEELGFTVFRKGEVTVQRGDILLNPRTHVEFCMGDGCCCAAHQNYDGRSGDRTGKEIQVRDQETCPFCKYQQYTYVIRLLPKPVKEAESEQASE